MWVGCVHSLSLASCYSWWLGFWLVALPSQGLVEFKNPYSYGDLAVSDAVTTEKCDCLSINNGCITLKHTHIFYYKVQMAMLGTKTKRWDFFLYITVNYHCEWVQFNESFCGSILPTFLRFYVLAILPEFLFWRPSWFDRRRNLSLRDGREVTWGNASI